MTKEQRRRYNQRYLKRLKTDPRRHARLLRMARAAYRRRGGHKKVPSVCIVCGKSFLGRIKVRQFCSKKCVSSGANNGRWNGGRYINPSGYVAVWHPKHPHAHSGKRYILEHRYVMEQLLGRLLDHKEHVHHINGIKHDNRAENLQVLSASEHSRLHQAANRARRR